MTTDRTVKQLARIEQRTAAIAVSIADLPGNDPELAELRDRAAALATLARATTTAARRVKACEAADQLGDRIGGHYAAAGRIVAQLAHPA